MSDVVATYGLDYGDYKKGLAAIDSMSAKHFQKQTKMAAAAAQTIGTAAKAFIGGSVIHTSIRLATASIGEFAERSPEAALALESISKAGRDAAASLGSDLFHGLGLAEGGFEGFIKGASEARESVVDFLASYYKMTGIGTLLGGDGSVEDINAARAADLDSQLFSKFQKDDAIRSLETRAGIAEAGGNSIEARTLREQARSKRANMEIGAIKYAPERDARKKQEDELHAANMAAIKREDMARAEADGKREAADQRRMAMEEAMYQLENESLAIDRIRAEGREAEAEQREVALEYARQEARIRGDASLSEEQRESRLRDNQTRRQTAIGTLGARDERVAAEAAADAAANVTEEALSEAGIIGRVQGTASIESGLGGRAGLRAQVFGPGGDGVDPMTKEQKRSNALLERIERNTANRQGGFAVFA